ncbi:hypothetical protein TTHERM_00535880 (macronuclear) [Tetrahymena thermophila SB210]|uniref:Uncharacterized protein n=1 Tax=Tetrahymena thermophila (strain SB210) TaxID=312017 RepID=I7MA23_TETTS|nr:hypothetical protein TTHERM_00535880 [Tetrahymena thermophila SB210]EAS03252.1 hypothetical protein TTHERM_00535880 [Tetrahymena thermophila SB210]|eukprot:XP_001023497.1 hypothetical protein TTHERM_00535880 [Tetrahymena thermophila SB210]
MSSRNQSPRGTATPQKKVQIQTQQANGGINSQPKTPKSPSKVSSSKGGSRSPPHSPSQPSRQIGTQPSGSRRQSPQSGQRSSSKNIRKQSLKGKQGEKQPPGNQDAASQKNNSNNNNKVFYDKNEIREAMSSPKQLEDYWNYQESVQRRVLDYKEKADQNLRKISEYNDKLRRIQQKCFDFDSVRDDIYSYKSQKRYHKSETEDSFQQTNEDQYDKKGYSTQVKLSPSNQKQVGFGTDRNRSQDRQALQYKIQQHEAYEKILNSKLKNEQNLNDLVELEKSIQLEKMGLQYFSKKMEDQIYLKQQINGEDSLRLSNDLYNQSPPKNLKKHVELQQDNMPEEFLQYKKRRNSTTKNQNDRFNTFQTYNDKKLEEEIQNSHLKEQYKKHQIDRSQLLTPEENELISSYEKKLKYSPKSSKNHKDLSNEKTPNSNHKYDTNRLTNLQYKYLLEKHDYEKFLNGKLDVDENTINKSNAFHNQKNNQNGLYYSDGKYRKKSITRLDTQQHDNIIRNRLGLTEDLSNAASRKSNHYPHSSLQQQKGERMNTNETNFTFLPNIQENRRVSLDTNQLNQNKYLRNLEIENLFQNQQKSNIFQRYSTPTNKHYIYNKS